MALTDVQSFTTPGKKSGWGLGSIIGSVVGGLAGALTANPGAVMAGIGAGAALGGTAGGAIGNAAMPGKSGDVTQVLPQQGTKSQRKGIAVATSNPDVQLAQMQNAKGLLKNSSLPNAESYIQQIDAASNQIKNRLQVGTGGV